MDIIRDLQAGQRTVATNIFRETNGNFLVSRFGLNEFLIRSKKIYDREYKGFCRLAKAPCPLVKANLDIQYSWLFGEHVSQ